MIQCVNQRAVGTDSQKRFCNRNHVSEDYLAGRCSVRPHDLGTTVRPHFCESLKPRPFGIANVEQHFSAR